MTDPLSITASVLGVASAGAKLATTLYTYAETAFRADKSLKSIARDVSLTSAVINELGTVLQHEDGPKLCSDTAVQTAQDTISNCKEVFEEIDSALTKSTRLTAVPKPAIPVVSRFVWPLKQQRMELIRSNLEKLKSTLMLMLQVLQYARVLVEDKTATSTLEQRNQIESLARINQESTRKHDALVKALDRFDIRDASTEPQERHFEIDLTNAVQLGPQMLPPAPDTGQNTSSLHRDHFGLIVSHLEQAIDAIERVKRKYSSAVEPLLINPSELNVCHRANDDVRMSLMAFNSMLQSPRPAKRVRETSPPRQDVATRNRVEANVAAGEMRTKTGRISTAKKGKPIHRCELCGKVYTRSEHLKRHIASQSATSLTGPISINVKLTDYGAVLNSLWFRQDVGCHGILTALLTQHKFHGTPNQCSLWLVVKGSERCILPSEKPLAIFSEVVKDGKKPELVLRKRPIPPGIARLSSMDTADKPLQSVDGNDTIEVGSTSEEHNSTLEDAPEAEDLRGRSEDLRERSEVTEIATETRTPGHLGKVSANMAEKGGALADYEKQMMLLEQHNKRRLLMARQEQEVVTASGGSRNNNHQPTPKTSQTVSGPGCALQGESSSRTMEDRATVVQPMGIPLMGQATHRHQEAKAQMFKHSHPQSGGHEDDIGDDDRINFQVHAQNQLADESTLTSEEGVEPSNAMAEGSIVEELVRRWTTVPITPP